MLFYPIVSIRYKFAHKVHSNHDHPWEPKKVTDVDSCSLFSGHLCNKSSKWDLKKVVVSDRLSLFEGGL